MITRLTPIFALMMMCNLTYSQLTISEISYNPPESGTDSLEYVEVVNTTASLISVKDYKFSKGITFTFPDVIIGAGKHFLIVKNARAFKAVYNITAVDWSPTDPVSTSNTLTNSGEILEIQDNLGSVLTSFKYDKIAPWPLPADGTDGNGKSIELCMLSADPSVGSNWKVSANDLGFMHNAKQVFGTPGTANSVTACTFTPDATVEVSSFKFTPADITINIGQTVRWKNIGGGHNVNGKVETFPSNPEGFFSGAASSANWEYDFKFTKAGLYKYHCDPHSTQMKGTVTVVDPNPPVTYPTRTITQMTSTNSEGVLDSLNKNCSLMGVVYGINLRPAGLQFTIIDANNNGVGVFNAANNFGYTVKEGDNVTVQGIIGQFNGFSQMTATAVTKNSENSALVSRKTITSFVENDESSLVSINNLSFVDPSEWTGTGSGFNVNMTNGTSTFAIRIDNDIDAFALPVPSSGPFNVAGLIGQFDSAAPFTDGYQLLPRYIADFSPAGSTSNEEFVINIMPNPTSDILEIKSIRQIDNVKVIDINGRLIQSLGQVTSIDMGNMVKGVYIVQFAVGEKLVTRRVWKM